MENTHHGPSCFAWFAGYAYQLMGVRKKEEEEARPHILAELEEDRVKVELQMMKYGEMMEKVRSTLAQHGEWALVWELDRVGMLGR